MKFIWLCSLFLLCAFINTNANADIITSDFYSSSAKSYSSDSLIFRYGKEAYLKKIWSLQYPREAIMSEKQGTMIFKITITPEGNMKAMLLTDLGKEINEAVTVLIGSLDDQFLVQPEEYSIYQTIFFSLHNNFQDAFEGVVDGFKTEYNGSWMEPAKSFVMMMSRTSSVPMGTTSGVRKAISASEAPTAFNVSNKRGTDYQLKNYNSKLKQYEKYVAKGKTKQAYNAVSELILYNPFDIKLIQARRRMEKELGVDTYRAFDIPLAVALSSEN
ncbi:hypothetical protein AWW67_13650 [Roseivirga seohaensis]|uniref:TonB C-terminal domain-containing protein n=2 Tax=Roseivirga seohaensis TaxID=1914963 RepID=A0A150XL11_9BACT|nr:hypothetical protein AWW67_13650 [Roseivirga seohaensis]